jgi:serine/threonine-protein kinase RsbW
MRRVMPVPETEQARFAIEVEPDPMLVRTVRMFGATLARRFGCEEETVQDIKVALSEACANAARAQAEAGVSAPLRLEVRCIDNVLSFSLSDKGGGCAYDPDDHDQALSRAAAEPTSILEAGIGVGLIRALFPAVAFERNDAGGMTVHIDIELPEVGT